MTYQQFREYRQEWESRMKIKDIIPSMLESLDTMERMTRNKELIQREDWSRTIHYPVMAKTAEKLNKRLLK